MRLKKFDLESLSNYWSEQAKRLKDFSSAPSTLIYRQSEINLFRKYFSPLKGKRLLKLDLWNEVNNTKILSWAAKEGMDIYGLDISEYLVEKSKENFKKEGLPATFIQSDIRNISFPDNYFDYLYTMGTIEHVPDYEKAVREIYRVLKPKGKAIVGVPYLYDPFLRPLIVWIMDIFNLYPYSPEKAFSWGELEDLLKNSGFEVVDKTGILFMPGILRMADLFFFKYAKPLTKITKILLKPFEYLERKYEWAKKHGYLIALVVRKK
jgi:ubiquinone/menaquinone biosynthesis C-methylase UbiE